MVRPLESARRGSGDLPWQHSGGEHISHRQGRTFDIVGSEPRRSASKCSLKLFALHPGDASAENRALLKAAPENDDRLHRDLDAATPEPVLEIACAGAHLTGEAEVFVAVVRVLAPADREDSSLHRQHARQVLAVEQEDTGRSDEQMIDVPRPVSMSLSRAQPSRTSGRSALAVAFSPWAPCRHRSMWCGGESTRTAATAKAAPTPAPQ
jgi:hypothetical protein